MARVCTICAHPNRAEIDARIVSGEIYRTIASAYNVSESALKRHKKHISEAVVDMERQKAFSDTARMMKELARGFDSLARAADQAEAEGDRRGLAQLWKAAADIAIPIFKIAGDLPGGGVTFNIYQSPQWVKIQAVILRELEPYPDIRVLLVEALEGVEGA